MVCNESFNLFLWCVNFSVEREMIEIRSVAMAIGSLIDCLLLTLHTYDMLDTDNVGKSYQDSSAVG